MNPRESLNLHKHIAYAKYFKKFKYFKYFKYVPSVSLLFRGESLSRIRSVSHSVTHTLDSSLYLTSTEGQEYFTGHVGHIYHMVNAFPTSH